MVQWTAVRKLPIYYYICKSIPFIPMLSNILNPFDLKHDAIRITGCHCLKGHSRDLVLYFIKLVELQVIDFLNNGQNRFGRGWNVSTFIPLSGALKSYISHCATPKLLVFLSSPLGRWPVFKTPVCFTHSLSQFIIYNPTTSLWHHWGGRYLRIVGNF